MFTTSGASSRSALISARRPRQPQEGTRRKDLTPRPPSLRGKGVPSSESPSIPNAREFEREKPGLPKAPPSLGGKGAGGLGRPVSTTTSAPSSTSASPSRRV